MTGFQILAVSVLGLMFVKEVAWSLAVRGRRLRWFLDNREDLRHLAYQFHPSVLDDLGLPVALRRLVDDISGRAGLKSAFHCRVGKGTIPQPVATCLYRIAQEGLGNVAKHANASSFAVELSRDDDMITLTINDDGSGFDVSARMTERGTLGLREEDCVLKQA